jgi:hypothetical protein
MIPLHIALQLMFLPEYRPWLDIPLPPGDSSKFLEYYILSENLPRFSYGKCPLNPWEMNTPMFFNCPTSRKPLNLHYISTEATHFVISKI